MKLERDGRPAAAVLLAARAGVDGLGDGRLARRARACGRRCSPAAARSPWCSSSSSNYHGPWLVDVVAGIASLVALARAPALLAAGRERGASPTRTAQRGPRNSLRPAAPRSALSWSAWMPWVLLTVFVFAWGLPSVKAALNTLTPHWRCQDCTTPLSRTAPVVPQAEARGSTLRLHLALGDRDGHPAGGRCIGVLAAEWGRAGSCGSGWRTVHRMRWPLVTIASMLAIAFTTRYSGMDATMGLAMTRTGAIYPFFAALLGWLGVALTGSDTSSNAMFGGLQMITATGLVAGRRPAARPRAGRDPPGRGQQFGGRDGEDDRRPEHRRGRGRRPGRPARKGRSCATSSATASPWPFWWGWWCSSRPMHGRHRFPDAETPAPRNRRAPAQLLHHFRSVVGDQPCFAFTGIARVGEGTSCVNYTFPCRNSVWSP